MTISERVAYIKGLADGMEVDEGSNEGKLMYAMLDVLKDIAQELEVIDEDFDEMAEIVGDLEDDVNDLCDEIYGEDSDLGDFDFDGDDMYEITCNKCENTLSVDMSAIEDGAINCPNCGEKIEFDIDFIGNDEDDS